MNKGKNNNHIMTELGFLYMRSVKWEKLLRSRIVLINYPNELMKARLYDKFLNSALLSI